MIMKLLVVLLVCAFFATVSCRSSPILTIPKFFQPPEAKSWAVLVAGSHGWLNYRHQADVCHAYQLLKNHGIPDERIIVMMVDDIAYYKHNPTQGMIINHPNGSDVYKGVPRDYTDKYVTPENFMAVLRGDKKALNGIGSGKVLESGPNDNVFIYFADHGAPGIICFPHSDLTARDLNKTIEYMRENKKYGKMLIYVEACESGSMFKNILPDNINVFATTAANSTQSSYACYFDDYRETFLGDVYSVNWIEDSESAVLSKETILEQYEKVKQETNKSQVQEFGDTKIAKMPLSEFQGKKQSGLKTSPEIRVPVPQGEMVRSRDVHIETLKRKLRGTNSAQQQSELIKELNKALRNRMFLTMKVKQIVSKSVRSQFKAETILNSRFELTEWDCYDEVRAYFSSECFNLSKNPYSLEYLYVLVNLCEKKIPSEVVKRAMDVVCVHPPVYDIL